MVNVVGSVLAGFALAAPLGGVYTSTAQLVIVGGLGGGLTTFSTLAVDTMQLVLARQHRAALANMALTFALGIAGAVVGLALGLALGAALSAALASL